jgi:O-antigen/teichoic acid export membrane protein
MTQDPLTPADPAWADPLAHEDAAETAAGIRRRTAAGMVLVATRSLLVLGLGTGGSVVLARLLTPHDFGVVALGGVLMSYAQFLSDGGLGATLIRDQHEPDRLDYANALGFQLAASSAMALIVAAIGVQFGQVGLLAALMIASLPILAFRAPGAIALERHLDYRPLIVIEVAETVSYYVWAIGTVLLGWGVWGLASAIVARAAFGTIVMLVVGPIGPLMPRISPSRVRRLLGFGASYQAVDVISLLRDTGVNIVTPAIASVSTLGLWTLVGRVLQPPLVVFQSLRRVSFPGMARLRDRGANSQDLVERGLKLSTLAAGLVLAPLAACAPAMIPAVFGSRWAGAAWAVPPDCLGLLLASPFSVAASGYLYAEGDASSVLRVMFYSALAWYLAMIPLLPFVGVAALGIGQLAAGAIEVVLFARVLRVHMPRIRSVRSVARELIVITLSAGLGWLVADAAPPNLVTMVVSAALAFGLVVAGCWFSARANVIDLIATTRRSVTGAVA